MGAMSVIDVDALRPDAQQVVLVSGYLAEVGTASVAELAANWDCRCERGGGSRHLGDTHWQLAGARLGGTRRRGWAECREGVNPDNPTRAGVKPPQAL